MSLTPAQITALATEINTDPTAVGYASSVTAGDDAGVAALLTVPGQTNVFRPDLTVREIIGAIVPAEFATMTQVPVLKLMLMFTGTTTLDATNANTRAVFLGIFTGMTATITALTALAQRKGSRAEILFGVGTVVMASDVSLALRGHG